MRKFLLLVTTCLLLIPLLLVFFLYLAVEQQPRIVRQVILAPEHIERAKHIIDTHRDQVSPDKLASANILAADTDIAANYLANHFAQGHAQVQLADQQASIRLSLPVPTDMVSYYLNLEANLVQTNGLPRFQSVRIGNLALPDFVTNILVAQTLQWLQQIPEIDSGLSAIKQVRMSQKELNITYQWDDSLSQNEGSLSILDEKERARLFRYHSLLVQNSRQHRVHNASLSDVLLPLMLLATKHATNGNAMAENRAVILATTFYVLGIPIEQLVPEAAGWPSPTGQMITLDGRDDLAKHFIVSAAITAYADTILSDAIGLYKEIEDSRSGSGFSFNDIAADRAGTRFGEKAVANQDSARQLQQLIASGLKDTDLMPAWSDLPEFMPEAEFNRRFGGIDTPTYRKMMEKIEKRISALRVLRENLGR